MWSDAGSTIPKQHLGLHSFRTMHRVLRTPVTRPVVVSERLGEAAASPAPPPPAPGPPAAALPRASAAILVSTLMPVDLLMQCHRTPTSLQKHHACEHVKGI